MTCSTRVAQRHISHYSTTPASSVKSKSKRNHWDAIAYCGSQFQGPVGTKQRISQESRSQKRRKTSTSRQDLAFSVIDHDIRHTPHGLSTARSICTLPTPKQSTPQTSISTLAHHQSLSTEPISLSLPTSTYISSTPLVRTHQHPPPVTHCYQLDRFLHEVPDFRTASFRKQECSGGRAKKKEKRTH